MRRFATPLPAMLRIVLVKSLRGVRQGLATGRAWCPKEVGSIGG